MSGGGSTGKGGRGGGSSQSSQDASNQLSSILSTYTSQASPVFAEISKQILSALQTGGAPQATIPIINTAQQQSRQATSNALLGTENQLDRAGLARTPFAANTLANVRQAGDQTTGLIPSNIVQWLLSGGASGATSIGTAPLAATTSGLASLSGQATNQNIAASAKQGGLLGNILGLGGSLGSSGALGGLFGGGAAAGGSSAEAALAASAAAALL